MIFTNIDDHIYPIIVAITQYVEVLKIIYWGIVLKQPT